MIAKGTIRRYSVAPEWEVDVSWLWMVKRRRALLSSFAASAPLRDMVFHSSGQVWNGSLPDLISPAKAPLLMKIPTRWVRIEFRASPNT